MIIQADLCKQAMEMDLYERIKKECENIEISMHINNAGVLYNGFFKDQTPEQIRE